MKKTFVATLIILNLFGLSFKVFAKGGVDKELSGEYFSIAEAYTELKKYDKALDYYQKAQKSETYKKASHYNMAQVYALQKDWKKCIKYLEPLHKEAPDNIKITGAYAYALASSGKNKKALELYKEIYDKNNDTPEYFFNYVRLLIIAKEYKTAKELLDAGKEKFTESEDAKTIEELQTKINEIKQKS